MRELWRNGSLLSTRRDFLSNRFDEREPMACPHCGGTQGVTYKDYGHVLEYVEDWGSGIGSRECVNSYSKLPSAKIGKCIDCGRGTKLKTVRGE